MDSTRPRTRHEYLVSLRIPHEHDLGADHRFLGAVVFDWTRPPFGDRKARWGTYTDIITVDR